jgi:hypothetical protein
VETPDRPARPTRRPQISNDQDQLQERETATFWKCHRRALTHFGAVPASIVYDRKQTDTERSA